MKRSIAAVVLTAGMSRRMGRNKLLLPFGAGTVLTHILTVLEACPLDETVVVTGHERENVEGTIGLCACSNLVLVHNPNYASGEMLSSIQAGLSAMRQDCQAALIVLGDQPQIERTTVEQIIAAHAPGRVVIPSHHRRSGHPILIDRACWTEVLALSPDENLRDLLHAHREWVHYLDVDTDTILNDMDTPDEYRRMTTNV